MPRNGEDARRRLQDAALELYRERGYERTTTAEIAARAGLTERTYFRHFADKREVLFEEDPRLRPMLTAEVAGTPECAEPLEILLRAFRSIGPLLNENRAFTEPRMEIIAGAPALRERAEAKTASLVSVLGDALHRKGVEEKRASLAAKVGMAAFSYAARSWFEDPSQPFDIHLTRAFEALHQLSSTTAQV